MGSRPTEKQTSKTAERCARVVDLGNSGDPAALPSLKKYLDCPEPEIRRLAALAIGKLAGVVDGPAAVKILQTLLWDQDSRVRRASLRAISAYGATSITVLEDLRDVTIRSYEKPVTRRDAAKAIDTIEASVRIEREQLVRLCRRCRAPVRADEYARNQRAFKRSFCDACQEKANSGRTLWPRPAWMS